MTTTIRTYVAGKCYNACFYDHTYGQLKELKTNEAVDIEDYSEDGWWAIYFEDKVDKNYTMEIQFKVDEYGNRTADPICAMLLDDSGIIYRDFNIDKVVKN